jgi:cytochrome P450
MRPTLSEGLFRRLHRRKLEAFAGIPGPTPKFPLGNAADFLGKKPWEVCARYSREFGGMAVFWLGPVPVVVLADPDLIAQVFNEKASGFYKDEPGLALAPVITRRCLFIANGEDWAYRRSIHPASGEVGREWLASAVPTLRDSVASGVARMARDPDVDLYDGLERVAFDAFAVATWGEPLGDEAYREFGSLGREGDRRMQTPLQFAPPLCPMFYADRGRWYGRFDGLIARAKRDPDPSRNDLLAMAIRKGPEIPHADFRDLMANVFFGGVYSATSGLVAALYLLARHPEEESKLREGLGAIDLDAPGLGLEALDACPRLGSTVLEALRCLSPVQLMARSVVTTGPVELGGHRLPANTKIFLTNGPIHRGEAHWPGAERFDPGRWESGSAPPLGSPKFFPFGQGPRACVGMPFALAYMKTALATILGRFRVEVDLSRPYQPTFFFGVLVPRGLKARFEPAARPAVVA